jgi:hypothetical protein
LFVVFGVCLYSTYKYTQYVENKMSIHNAISGVSVDNNNGIGFGVRHTSDVLGSVNLGLAATRTGSVVIDGADTDEAVVAGTFAFNNQRPVAKRLTDSLSGVNNDVLLSGAARPDLVKSVHRIESITTRRVATAIRAGYWNIYTGTWSTNPTNASDSFGNDNAARPSRSAPGNLTYKLGNPTAVTVGYSEKTN